jgi:CBS domain-containing protein
MIIIQQTNDIASEIVNHKLTHADREASVLEVSKLMRKAGTTELLVTGEANGMLLPVGIVTANDIVTRVIAAELDPTVLTAGDIAWSGMAAADTADSDAKGVRHPQENNRGAVAVMDGDGQLVGTVRLDELMGTLSPQPGTV